MGSFSVLGMIVAVVAVVAAYYAGYSSGRAVGRDEGFGEGKKEGSREGSMRAYAVGFDRGKRAVAGNDDDDNDGGKRTSNKGIVIFALVLGLLLFLWLSSPTGDDPRPGDAEPIPLPRVNRSVPAVTPLP